MVAVTNYEIVFPSSLAQFSSTAGTITLDSTDPWTGGLAFLFGAGGTANINYATLGGVADAGNGQIFEMGFQVSHNVPGAGEDYDLYRHSTLDPFSNLGLGFNDSGHTRFKDDGGTVRGTWANTIAVDTWHHWAFYFENAGGTSGVLGPVELMIEEAGYNEILAQVTGIDTLDAPEPWQDRILHNTYGTPPPQNTVTMGWYRHRSGCASIADKLGPPPRWMQSAAMIGGSVGGMVG